MRIAEALRTNKTLEEMDLGYNGFGEEGREALINALSHNVWIRKLYVFSRVNHPRIKYLTQTRNKVMIPAAVRRASLCLIHARRNTATAGALACFPKEIVKLIAMEVWATRNDPKWLETLTESERTGELRDYCIK